jgi:hypothetical protein
MNVQDYHWVDEGLKLLNLEIDLKPKELPMICRRRGGQDGKITIDDLMKVVPNCFFSDNNSLLLDSIQKQNVEHSWSVTIGKYNGNPTVTDVSIIDNLTGFRRDDFLKFVVDDAMIDVAKLWDDTFVSGQFSHIIAKDGKVYDKNKPEYDPHVLLQYAAQDIAKIMTWKFAVPGLSQREICSVYVTKMEADAIYTCYFPVRGKLLPEPNILLSQFVRGKLMVPCLDRIIFDSSTGTSRFEHYATASLQGWMPMFVLNSSLGKAKFLESSCLEVEHLRSLFLKQSPQGQQFEKIRRRDRTSFL